MKFRSSILPLALFLITADTAFCADLDSSSVVRLKFGPTTIDLTGDGRPAMAVLGHRENFNAHSFDVLTLYVQASLQAGGKPTWQIVPAFDGDKQHGDKEWLTITASGGADCMLHDFRVLKSKGRKGAMLVIADRALGESYADKTSVTFKFYELIANQERLPGRPLYFFELKMTESARQIYCDVGEAFSKELQLGPYRD